MGSQIYEVSYGGRGMQPGHMFHGQALQDLVVLTTQREQHVCVRSQRAPTDQAGQKGSVTAPRDDL